MLNSISGMNSYYSMYRYGFSYGNSSVRQVQKLSAPEANLTGARQAENTASSPVSANAVSGSQSRPAIFWSSRLYLTSPAADSQTGEGASASGLMQAGTSPEELAVRMRIQYAGQEEEKINPEEEKCQTCEKRKYQDGSDDMGVSFQTPTHVAPEAAAAAVRGHEQEHVVREQAKAEQEGRRVVSQDVTLHTDICPECGEVYISGGTTRTVTAADTKQSSDAGFHEAGQLQTNAGAVRSFFAVA